MVFDSSGGQITKDELDSLCHVRFDIFGICSSSRCQFHQDFTSSFFIQKMYAQLYCTSAFDCILLERKFAKKSYRKMLVKLTSDLLIVLIVSVMKGLTPIATAVVNFGKLQYVIALYWDNFLQRFSKLNCCHH